MTQKEMIIQWFSEHETLDRLQAFTELGIFELSARICDLKRNGYTFTSNKKSKLNKYGNSFTYSEYRMEK